MLQLHLLLQSTEKGSTPVDEYILKMRALTNVLIAFGQTIANEELVLYILGCLGADYESIIVNFSSCKAITSQEVQFILQSQEMHLKQLNILNIAAIVDPQASNNANYVVVRRNNGGIREEVLVLIEIVENAIKVQARVTA